MTVDSVYAGPAVGVLRFGTRPKTANADLGAGVGDSWLYLWRTRRSARDHNRRPECRVVMMMQVMDQSGQVHDEEA